jgi:hypothetical protein
MLWRKLFPILCKCVLGHVRRSRPSILDLVTILYASLAVLNQHTTPTLFDMIGICKHERATSIGDIGLAIIVAEIN